MGSSRKLFLLLGVLFVVLFLLSSQVAPSKDDQTTAHSDKKNRNMYSSLKPPIVLRRAPFASRPLLPPCYYIHKCSSSVAAAKAGEFTKDQFKDDFHN